MKSKFVVALVVFAGLTLCSVNANAGKSEIVLGATSQNVRFQGTGSSSTLDFFLGTCTKNKCDVEGHATGTGILTSGPARYFLSTVAFVGTTPNITLTLLNATLGTWKVNELSPIAFRYGTLKSPLLTGDLELLSFQDAPGSHTGTFNYKGVANLTDLGGSLAHLLTSAGGIVDLSINLRGNIESLLGTNNTMASKGASGKISAVPELGSMLLLGSGLLLVGSFLRRQLPG